MNAAPCNLATKSSPQSQKSDSTKTLPVDYQPGPFDVVCAKGKKAVTSTGYLFLNTLVMERALDYAAARSKSEKTAIVSSVIKTIGSISYCGGFVKKQQDRWCIVDADIVRNKVRQRFRDILCTKYSSSSRTKRSLKPHRSGKTKKSHTRTLSMESDEVEEGSMKEEKLPWSASNIAAHPIEHVCAFVEFENENVHAGLVANKNPRTGLTDSDFSSAQHLVYNDKKEDEGWTFSDIDGPVSRSLFDDVYCDFLLQGL